MNLWLTRRSLVYRTYIHWRVVRRLLGWPLGVTGMAVLLFFFALDTEPEFGKTSLTYGLFMAPLMAIWVVPRLFPSRTEMGWQVASKIPRWRLVLEYGWLGLALFGFLWACFLSLAWLIHSIFVTQFGTSYSVATPAFVWWLWLNGLLSLFVFTGIAVLGSQLWNSEAGGFLATGIWTGSLLLARMNEWISDILPFSAFYRLARSDIDLQAPDLGMQTGFIFLFSLAVWAAGIWSSSTYQETPLVRKTRSHRPVQDLVAGNLFWGLRGPYWLRLVWQELRWAIRRRFFWVYLVAPIGLFMVIAGFTRSDVITDFIPLMMSNFLFFTPPLFAVFLVPALTRNALTGRDWYWSTPALWSQTALAQLLSYCALALVTVMIWGASLFAWGFVQEFWSWQQALTLVGPVGRLWLTIAISQACLICGLALLFRQAMVVIFLTCVLTVGLWLTMDVLTLVTPTDVALVSLSFNSITGPGPDQALAESLAVTYLAIGLGVWLVALAIYPVWERRATWTQHTQIATWCIAVAGLGMSVMAGWNYVLPARELMVPATVTTATTAWKVVKASHHAHIGDGKLELESQLTLIQPFSDVEPVLSLQLNPNLFLVEAKWEDQEATWTRSGEVVQIALPDAAEKTPSKSPVDLFLRYTGWPVLLREDYASPITGGILGTNFIRFYPRANVSYAQAPFLQWFRDSDWTVWPLASGPQVATQANSWTIELSHATYPVIAAPGSKSDVAGERTLFTWQETPPSVLLLAGPFDPSAPGEPSVWLGPWQRPTERDRIKPIMEMYQRLAAWSGEGSLPVHGAYFPYGQRLHFADSWVMVPANSSVNDFQSDRERLDQAVRVAEDWLLEQLEWQHPSYSDLGLHDAIAVRCEIAEARSQTCFLDRDQYRRNPQAPLGRTLEADYCLYPSNQKCGSISHIRRAWAINLGYYIAADPEWLQSEWAEWYRIAQSPGEPESSHSLAGTIRTFQNLCLLSSYVLTIHESVEQHGLDSLRDWFTLIQELHPIGGLEPVDRTAWELAAEATGKSWSGLYPTVCTEVELEPT